MAYCCYSNQEVDAKDLSAEHIIPRALGGAVENNPLLLKNVSTRANNILGTFVDRPFVRSYLVQLTRFTRMLRYIDINKSKSIRMMYLGTAEDYAFGTKICDLWIDPARGYIYHFHDPYPDMPDVPVYSGFPIHLLKSASLDPGFCLWVVGATNPLWHNPLYTAIGEEFPGAPIYFVNARPSSGSQSMPSDIVPLRDRIMKEHGPQAEMKLMVTQSLLFADRWLAKTALGVGCVLLGEKYARSDDAELLRRFMFERNSDARQTILMHGSGFLSTPPLHGLCVGDCHTLTIMDAGLLGLHVCLYGSLSACVMIARDRKLWEGALPNGRGLFYLVAPGIGRAIGPKPVESLLAHSCIPPYPDTDITDILKACDNHPQSPPVLV